MKSFSLDDPWKGSGVPHWYTPRRLLYSRPANVIVALLENECEDRPPLERIYYRSLPAQLYDPIPVTHELETQNDVFCCEDSPYVIYNTMVLEAIPEKPVLPVPGLDQSQDVPRFAGNWTGIRRFDLAKKKVDTVFDAKLLLAEGRCAQAWICSILRAFPDGTGCTCSIGLMASSKMDYSIWDVSFARGSSPRLRTCRTCSCRLNILCVSAVILL